MDDGEASEVVMAERRQLLQKVVDLDRLAIMDIMQKAKIKWAIEGDENSKFYHGILKRKRKNLAMKGVNVEGVWVTEPTQVKNVFILFLLKEIRKI